MSLAENNGEDLKTYDATNKTYDATNWLYLLSALSPSPLPRECGLSRRRAWSVR